MVLHHKNKRLNTRLGFALRGWRVAIAGEKSIRFQLIAAILALLVLGFLQPPIQWWAIIITFCVLVLALELMNTALESICDLLDDQYNEAIRNAKDVAAGAVLLASVGALLVGVLLLLDVI